MGVTSAVIPASGHGRRLNSDVDKIFVPLAQKPLLAHTLAVFQGCQAIDEIVLVVREDQIETAKELVRDFGFSKVIAVVAGGEERQDSVRNGLAAISPETDIVVIHDGARPLVTPDIILSSIEAASAEGAAITAVPVIDTIKSSRAGVYVESTLYREELYFTQTPQSFTFDIIDLAYEQADAQFYTGTDDASLVEFIGLPVRIVEGSYENIKVTTPGDICLAEEILRKRANMPGSPEADMLPNEGVARSSSLLPRIGHGYDIHRFAEGRRLILGGVEFPGEMGLLGHSDADVMLHAVADAVLGAIGEGDIGRHFPDTDPAFKDAESSVLLARTAEIAANQGWIVGNVDVTLICERPKIAGHASVMCTNISDALKVDSSRVSVKASTAEGLGSIGEGLGIECHAVVLLYPMG